MTTESDLRFAIERLADEAEPEPFVERILQSAHGSVIAADRRRSQRLLPLVAAAAVAVIAVGVAATWYSSSDGTASDTVTPTSTLPCATPNTPSFTTFSVGRVSDLDSQIVSAATCSGYRTRDYYTSSGGILGSITLYRKGTFGDAAVVKFGRPVHGNGISGYYVTGDAHRLCSPSATTRGPCFMAGVAWQYADHAWATISVLDPELLTARGQHEGGVAATFFGSNPLAKLLAMAAAVHPDRSQALVRPFRVADLAGLLPLSADTGTTSLHHNDVGRAGARLLLSAPGNGSGCPSGAACTDDISINVESTVSPPGGSLGDFRGRRVRIGSHAGLLTSSTQSIGTQKYTRAPELRFQVDHWFVIIRLDNAHSHVTDDQLVRIARSMTFAPSTTDSGTWYTFNHALPS